MKVRSFISISILLFVLSACIVRPYVPVPNPGYGSEDRWAVLLSDSLVIAIRPQAYIGNVQSINSNFFVLFLKVKNISSGTVSLRKSSFNIIVEDKQHDFIPLELVLGSMQSSFFMENYQDPFALNPLPANYDKAREQYFEVLNNYFSFGDILPGGMKEGYLFYNRNIHNFKSFSVDALFTRIHFSK
ncbi:MAG: hypothetical protein Q8M98_00235 [Candidatus Cloacimonadaceae bacterium]|nr:hypothetical protein [Candidatus Cloacimonadaceae bacterium]MDP3113179.1 hypothetical protein [Candidatus Cloacimonadaceae bacterium]